MLHPLQSGVRNRPDCTSLRATLPSSRMSARRHNQTMHPIKPTSAAGFFLPNLPAISCTASSSGEPAHLAIREREERCAFLTRVQQIFLIDIRNLGSCARLLYQLLVTSPKFEATLYDVLYHDIRYQHCFSTVSWVVDQPQLPWCPLHNLLLK